MRLSAIEVNGFRSLTGAPLHGLATVNALVGRNNSGKTAILESLLLLSTLTNDPDLAALDAVLPWGDRSIADVIADSVTNVAERGSINLRLHFNPTIQDVESVVEGRESFPSEQAAEMSWLYEFTLRKGEPDWPSDQLIPVSVLWLTGDQSYPIVEYQTDRPPSNLRYKVADIPKLETALAAGRPGPMGFVNQTGSVEVLMQQGLRGEGITAFRPLMNWVRNIRFVSRTRQGHHTVRLADSSLLRSDGSNLARYFQDMYNNHPQKWNELKGILRQLVPWLRDIYVPIEEEATSARIAVRAEQDAADAFALVNMGSGTVHLMTIVSMVWSTPDGGLCLIEEPEAGLHNTAQRDLLLWLRWHARERNKQLILATHSTLFSKPADNVSVYLATYAPDAGTQFQRLAVDDAPQVVRELGARLADLYAYDCLLFLEGTSEMNALPPILDALEMDLEVLGVRPVPLHGDVATRLQRLREYLDYMQGSQVLPFVITDDDAGVRRAIEDLQASGHIKEDHVYIWHRKGALGEFEDNFSDDQLIRAMNDLAAAEGVKPTLHLSALENLRTKRPKTKTSRLLGDLYFSKYAYSLPKPRLAERLGEMAAQDIEQGKRDYQIVAALEQLQQAVTTKGQPA